MVVVQTVWPLPSMVDDLLPTIEQALENHKHLTDKMLVLATVPPGPYALFHHNSYVYERMTDIQLIVTRLLGNRKLLTELARKDDALRPKKQVYKQTLSVKYLKT